MQPENLAPDPDTLVEVLWEWFPRDEAAHALADADVPILKDNLALADDHQGEPWHSMPSKMLYSTVDLWLLAVKVFILSGSQMTTSASEPTAIRPFLGYRLKILAALVLVTATN